MYITGMVMIVLKLYTHGVKSSDGIKVLLYPEKQSLGFLCILPEIFYTHTRITLHTSVILKWREFCPHWSLYSSQKTEIK